MFNKKEKLEHQQLEQKKIDDYRVKNEKYFNQFLKNYESELHNNRKDFWDDGITVHWSQNCVFVKLCGYHNDAITVSTSTDPITFKTELELTYENMKIHRYNLQHSDYEHLGKKRYLEQRNALRSHLNEK